ncbi:Demethylmenaquinone methyltransferase [Mycena venus]|uniref:Demethylmenaquinone methyltransferase n=1 Tax=Mycena venus TaxID=2733690 RepID=A0A8H6Z2Q2_9AGAR|nr:Demethylmenaquinone methyltransferase [Mycena venus]
MTSNTESQVPASRDEYVFTRDFLDNNRINLMHHLWTKMFGYLLHPKIPTDKADLRVADVGTGTGIWLFDVGEMVSKSARLEGFDVSFDATPPPETLPSNVSFRHWNVKEDVPEDLIGVFDVVHVRFFSFVLLVDDVPRVVERLFKMLKPGGYLQWADPDYKSLRIDTAKPETKTPNLSELFKLMAVQDQRLNPTWLTDLPEIFASTGFTDIEADKKDGPPHLAFIFHEAGLMIHELIYRKTKNAKMQEELKRLLPKAVEETREGAYATAVRWTVVGRKPEV